MSTQASQKHARPNASEVSLLETELLQFHEQVWQATKRRVTIPAVPRRGLPPRQVEPRSLYLTRRYLALRQRVERVVWGTTLRYQDLPPAVDIERKDYFAFLKRPVSSAIWFMSLALAIIALFLSRVIWPEVPLTGTWVGIAGLSLLTIVALPLLWALLQERYEPERGVKASTLYNWTTELRDIVGNIIVYEYHYEFPNEETASNRPEGLPETSSEVSRLFARIYEQIENSSIEREFRTVALFDLAEAENSYAAESYKASIVMLGAVLEGLMLATLRRSETIERIRSNLGTMPKPIRQLQPAISSTADFRDSMAQRLYFEDYKNALAVLIPELDRLKVENIQNFRNAIHPWKAVREPTIYANPDSTRAMHYLTALSLLVDTILRWHPE